MEHFLAIRGKGCAVSSADEALLLGWESEGIPMDIVIDGIDLAFERKRDAPKSLQQCGRWIKQLYKKWADEAGQVVEKKQTATAGWSGSTGSSSQTLPGLSDKHRHQLMRWRKHTLTPLRQAADAMWTDLQSQAESDGVITEEVASIIEDAVRMMAEENGATAAEVAVAMS